MNNALLTFPTGRDQTASAPQQLQLLIVDENEQDLGLLATMLDGECTVDTASSVREAQAFCQQYTPDCILIDAQLQQNKGMQLLNTLRSDPRMKYVAVLILAAESSADSVREAFKSGADDHLTKQGLSRELLHQAINNAYYRKTLNEAVDVERHSTAQENKELSRRHQLFESYWAEVSHNMLTHLSAIHEFVSLCLDEVSGPVNEEQGKCLALARGSCLELERDINKIVNVTQMARDPGKMVWTPESLAQTVSTVLDDLRLEALSDNVTLASHIDAAVHVFTDRFALSQSLYHMLQHALQLATHGSEISVYTTAAGADRQSLRIRVHCDDITAASIDHDALDWQLQDVLASANATELHSKSVAGTGVEFGIELLNYQHAGKEAEL